MIMVKLKVILSLTLSTNWLLHNHHALAFEDNGGIVRIGLTGRPGHFDLNSLPPPEFDDDVINSSQLRTQTELATSTHQSIAPEDVDLFRHFIISKPRTSHGFRTQGIPSTSTSEIDDKLARPPNRKIRLTDDDELQKAPKETQTNILKLLRSAPAIEREKILRNSVKTSLEPQFESGFKRGGKIDTVDTGRNVDQELDHRKDPILRIRSFKNDIPIPLPSAASIFYADRMLGKISDWLKFDTAHDYASWTSVWTKQTILPFVYFIMIRNPSYYMWERIEKITIRLWKIYHLEYIHEKPDYDKENLARFLLWHTEVMSQVARLSDLSETPAESLGQDLDLPRTRLSPILRIIISLLKTTEYETYTSAAYRRFRIEHLKRYIDKSWKRDQEKHYPGQMDISSSQSSVWLDWNLQSKRILQNTHNVPWPLIPNEFFFRDKNIPVLLVREESKLHNYVEGSNLSGFITNHSEDFIEVLKRIQGPKRPELRSKIDELDMFRGLNYFLNAYQEHSEEQKVSREKRCSLDLLSEFLEQDPQSEKFGRFWLWYEGYKQHRLINNRHKNKSIALKKQKDQTSKKRVSREEKNQQTKNPYKKRVLSGFKDFTN